MRRKLLAEIYDLAWPVLIAQLAVMAYAVIDTMMAGRFATEDLAAVGIGASIYFSVFVALMGVLLAVSPTVAQLLGAGRYAEIGEQVRQGMWLTVALAMLSVLVFRYPGAAAGAEPGRRRGRRQGAGVSRDRRMGRAGGPRIPAVRELHHRRIAPARDDGAESSGPGAQGAAQLGVRLRTLGAPAMGAAGCALSTTLVNWIICILAWLWCGCRRRTAATASSRTGPGRAGTTSAD